MRSLSIFWSTHFIRSGNANRNIHRFTHSTYLNNNNGILNTQTPFTTNPDDIKTVITVTEIIKINVYYDIYGRNIVITVRKKWLAIKFKHLLPSRMSLEAPWRQSLNKSVRYKKELLLKVEKKPARELCTYFLGELLYLGLWVKFVELRTYKTILVDVTKLHKKIKRR